MYSYNVYKRTLQTEQESEYTEFIGALAKFYIKV